MFKLFPLLTVFVAASLSACAVTDHFDDRVGRYDLAAAQSRDTMVLTNIVRASHAEPLSFVQLGQLSGTTTTGGTLGLPALILGPHAAGVTALSDTIFGGYPAQASGFVGNQANLQGTTNFQATPAETKEFYRGLLQEVDPRTLSLFIQQGIAREILFYLFTDRVIEVKGGVRRELRNDPLAPDFADFRHYVALAMAYGLASEMIGKPDPEPDPAKRKPEKWRLCFDPLHMSAGVARAGDAPVCGSGGGLSGDGRIVSFDARNGERVTLEVLPRSAFAIFGYLGRIVAAGDQGKIPLSSPEAIDEPPLSDPYQFTVVRGGGGANCFIATLYEGDTYCVPREGAANTKRILGLLTQLIALNTDIADVPVAPTVRVVP